MKRSFSWESIAIRVFALLFILSSILSIQPILFAAARKIFVLTAIMGVFVVLPIIIKRLTVKKWLFYPCVVLIAGMLAWLALGARPVNESNLRNAYVQELRSFAGVRYIWGGENRLGIDCSGLARTALWHAMLKQGIYSGNPRLMGFPLWAFWYRDLSARGMLGKEHGYTSVIGHAVELSRPETYTMDEGSTLLPGDLAVTSNGDHVMIYTGDGNWIEANPVDGKVVENKSAGSKRGFFGTEVTFMRWWLL